MTIQWKKWVHRIRLKLLFLSRHYFRLIRGLTYFFLDAKYGSRYLGTNLKNIGRGDLFRGWHGSQSSDYHALAKLFSDIVIHEQDVIVDVGCGRGRVFNYLLHCGLKNKLIGIEVDPAIANITRNRLKKYNQIEILDGNIEDENALPNIGTIYYLFNPFTDRIVKKFADILLERMKRNSASVIVSSPNVPRLVRGIQRSSFGARFLDPADKPRDVEIETNDETMTDARGSFKTSSRPLIIYYNCAARLYIFEENPVWKIRKLGAVSHTGLQAAIITPQGKGSRIDANVEELD